MISQIQFGNIFSQNGKQIVSGGATGFDIESLVNGLADAKRLPAVQLEKTLENNAKKSDAYAELKTILAHYKDAANFLRNPPGVQNSAENIFEFRTGALTSNTSISGETYLNATVEPGTDVQNFVISDISQLAKAKKQYTNDPFVLASVDGVAVFAAPAAGQFGDGTVTFNGASIDLVAGDSLQDVADKFNAVTDTTGIEATILQVASGQYQMVFTATETGESADFDLENALTVTADPGGAFAQITFATAQGAQNAMFKIDNIDIERESNSVDDLIDGVTLTLKQETPAATEIEFDITPDTELIKTGILNFVDAYNQLRLFASKQTETNSDGTTAETAILSNSNAMRTTLARVTAEMSAAVQGLTAGDPSRLSDLGITFSDFPGDDETPFTRNIMTVDEDQLASSLSSDFDAVRNIFEFNYTTDIPDLQVFRRTNAIDVTDLDLNINLSGNVFQATYDPGTGPVTINLTKTNIQGGGITLTAAAGTVLEGLTLIYGGTADVTGNMSLSQGIADRTYNELDQFLNEDTGVVEVEISALDDRNTRIQKEIDRIDEVVERFRDQLLEKFAALEKAVSQVNTLLQSLDAQAQARANA